MNKIDRLRARIKNMKSIDTVFLFVDKFNNGYKVDVGTRETLKSLRTSNKENLYVVINRYTSISSRVNIMAGFGISIDENLIENHNKCKVVITT